jgi:hypothetical protein
VIIIQNFMFPSCGEYIFIKNQTIYMKKILITAAVAFFAASAFAQTNANDEHGKTVSATAKETTLKHKEKGEAISEAAKSKSHSEFSKDDLDRDGKLSTEEREARKAAKKQARKDDKDDDGVINGSTNNSHGTAVSTTAKETILEGKEKGKAISDGAKSKAKNGQRAERPTHAKPAKVNRPTGAGRSKG